LIELLKWVEVLALFGGVFFLEIAGLVQST
jgi:hypothetical protein